MSLSEDQVGALLDEVTAEFFLPVGANVTSVTELPIELAPFFSEYITRVGSEPLKPGEVDSTERKVLSVDVVGDAAVARLALKRPNAHLTDYMSLLKVDGRWLIVNKIFTRETGSEHAGGS